MGYISKIEHNSWLTKVFRITFNSYERGLAKLSYQLLWFTLKRKVVVRIWKLYIENDSKSGNTREVLAKYTLCKNNDIQENSLSVELRIYVFIFSLWAKL